MKQPPEAPDRSPATTDAAARRRLERLRLIAFLDRLDAEHGAVDEKLIQKYVELLR